MKQLFNLLLENKKRIGIAISGYSKSLHWPIHFNMKVKFNLPTYVEGVTVFTIFRTKARFAEVFRNTVVSKMEVVIGSFRTLTRWIFQNSMNVGIGIRPSTVRTKERFYETPTVYNITIKFAHDIRRMRALSNLITQKNNSLRITHTANLLIIKLVSLLEWDFSDPTTMANERSLSDLDDYDLVYMDVKTE